MTDNVNHPPHYISSSAICACGKLIECIDIVRNQNFCVGNAIKYMWRYRIKNGIEDLKKAIWYLKDQIQRKGKYQFKTCICQKCFDVIEPGLIVINLESSIGMAFHCIARDFPMHLAVKYIEEQIAIMEVDGIATK